MKALVLSDPLMAHHTWRSMQDEGHFGILAARYRKNCFLLLVAELERCGGVVVLAQERLAVCFVGVLAL